jgi:dinuclear metal center YbgI/SA1388 family protein
MSAPVKIADITNYLESLAPRSYQETYDNSGLLTGDPQDIAQGVLVTLDCTEEVIAEAIHLKCNLIVAHHPIVFKGLKKLTGSHYVERVIILAIKHDIAIYAIHTNLDNIAAGVNRRICEQIGLQHLRILAPRKDTLSKLVTFIPLEHGESVLAALYAAGAGQIGQYKNCSFSVTGTGTFKPDPMAKPYIGKAQVQENVQEIRAELIFPSHVEQQVLTALRTSHPYEEIAYFVTPLTNENQEVGSGMVGELDKAMEPLEFLKGLKVSMALNIVRHTPLINTPVKKVAVCGGSGSFLISRAIQSGAQVFITADVKYHDFFEADNRIIIADIGHYESEAFTKQLIIDVLIKKFPSFAINFSKTVTNPISYL